VGIFFSSSRQLRTKEKGGNFQFFSPKILEKTKGFREELRETHTHTCKHLIKKEREAK